MGSPADYLTSLRRKGVHLWLCEGQVHYHGPKDALTQEDLAQLRSMKDALAAELARDPGAGDPPLSFQQRWLWDLMNRHPKWRRSQGFAFKIEGSLQPEVLRSSWSDVLRTHGLVNDCKAPSVAPLDLVEIEAGSALELVSTLTNEKLDEIHGPVGTAHLLLISPTDNILVLLIHRLIADCPSIKQLFEELWVNYAVTLAVQKDSKPQSFAFYRDYAVWQHATAAEWQQRHEKFWHDYLEGAEPLRWPPGDEPRLDSDTRLIFHSSIGCPVSEGLRAVSGRTKILPSIVVLAVFIAAAARICEQRDFVIPFNMAGRRAEYENVSGYFSCIIYIRIRLSGDETPPQLLQLVSREFYRVMQHQDSGRLAYQRRDLLSAVFWQWLGWHPADAGGVGTSVTTDALGLCVRPIRFQSAEDLSSLPCSVVETEVSFFEADGDIQLLVIHRESYPGTQMLVRMMEEIRLAAERLICDTISS